MPHDLRPLLYEDNSNTTKRDSNYDIHIKDFFEEGELYKLIVEQEEHDLL